MKSYNYDLAIKIVDIFSSLNTLKEASLGMHEDWFWTAHTIWEDGEWKINLLSNEEADKMYSEFIEKRNNGMKMFLDEKDDNGLHKINPEYEAYYPCLIGGLRGSDWATPVIHIELEDGTEKTFNCFIGESECDILEKIEREINCTSGCISNKVQQLRKDIDVENFDSNA